MPDSLKIHTVSPKPDSPLPFKILLACLGGNIIEWYDFMIYGYFSSIIGQLFFPSNNKTASLLLSLMVFAVGVIARPLGGIVIGHIGDKISRKNSLMIGVYLMFFPTALMGILPTYHDIGVLAPILLFILRVLQGLAMGGEYAGAMIYMIESAPPKRKGLYGSFAALSLVAGMFLGSLMTMLVQQLPEEIILAGGWRIPFLVSVIGLFYTIYMRQVLTDTPTFNKIKMRKELISYPFKEMWQKYTSFIGYTILFQTVLAIGMYTVTVYYINYSREFLPFPKLQTFSINMLATAILGVSAVLSGWLSDIFSRKKVLLNSTLLIIGCSFLSMYLSTFKEINLFLCGQIILSISIGQFLGATPTALAEFFPPQIRYTSIAFTNNAAMGIFGGTAPLAIFYGTSLTSDPYIPAYYLSLGAVISLLSLLKIYRRTMVLDGENYTIVEKG